MQPLNFKTMNCKECNKELTPDNHSKRYGNWCNECKNAYQKKYRQEKGYIYDQTKYQDKHKAKKQETKFLPEVRKIQRDNFITVNGIQIY